VVTRDYFNSRRLMEIGLEFPVLVYTKDEDLGELIKEPPSPICFYTTQQRISIVPESALAIRRCSAPTTWSRAVWIETLPGLPMQARCSRGSYRLGRSRRMRRFTPRSTR
jgi:hypothetical protein